MNPAIQELRAKQLAAGATLTEDTVLNPYPLSFHNEAAVRAACTDGVALYDRTHWGRLQVSGDDRLRFLHNQTTNSFNGLQPGQGCDTVFVTSTARTIDLVTAYVLEEAVLLLTSPGLNQQLLSWMDRFIFFADKVDLKDLTDSTAAFSVLGADSDRLITSLGAGELIGLPPASHQQIQVGNIPVQVAIGSGLAIPGYTLIVAVTHAAALWQQLIDQGALPMGETLWQELRIGQGRPAPGQELTEDYNPLEAGLWQTISLSKGCYIGQETIARLHTYRGVKQQLWGVRLTQAAAPDSIVRVGTEKIGRLTSCVATPDGYLGLAYIRTKNVEPGLTVVIEQPQSEQVQGEQAQGEQQSADSKLADSKLADSNPTNSSDQPNQAELRQGKLVELPFVNHEYP